MAIIFGPRIISSPAERINLTTDTRTATEYGVVRTYANMQFDFSQNRESIAGGFTEVDYAFIQFAGFTFGKAVSQFDPQWALNKPCISSGFMAGSNNTTGIPQIAYTASFGNGVSATISLENASAYRNCRSLEHQHLHHRTRREHVHGYVLRHELEHLPGQRLRRQPHS